MIDREIENGQKSRSAVTNETNYSDILFNIIY